MKRWVINTPDESIVNDLSAKCDLTPLALKVMISRGYDTLEKLAEFFNESELESPFELNDMQDAVDTINRAVDTFDLICIYGDYDCDGVTATAILYNYLDCMGANVTYYIPSRDEGYGMNEKAIRELHAKGVSLIVTVDNGISAIEEAKLIKELGMELVITDHHQPLEELPVAKAVVNPHRADSVVKYTDLAGVGVALKLCAALDGGDYDSVLEQYADIVAIGTIADVVPLTGENRSIVKQGLALLQNTENPGLLELLSLNKLSQDKINSTAVAYMLSPKINAAGRFGSPITALKMLIDEEQATSLAEELMSLNDERKNIEAKISDEIKNAITKNPDLLNERVITIAGKGWHHGVVGIVAAKICEKYGKPCVLLSVDEDGVAKGSARSVPGFNIFRCFKYCADLLERFGGHECAGGVTVVQENIGEFFGRIKEYADSMEKMPFAQITADKLLTREDLTVGQIASLSMLEPIGAANAQPVFAMLHAKVQKVIPLSQGKHTKLELAYDSTVQTALCFGKSPQQLGIFQGDVADLMVNASINEYNGSKSISLKIIDIRPSGVNQAKALAAIESVEGFLQGKEPDKKLASLMLPCRDDFLLVYKAIKTYKSVSLDTLMCRMFTLGMNMAKTRICVDGLSEAGVLRYDAVNTMIELVPNAAHADLDRLEIIKRLKKCI